MKNITILIDQFYQHGGIEKLVAIKANYWSKTFGYKVNIISTENKGEKLIYDIDKRIIFKDLSINYNRTKSYFSPKNLFLFVKNLIKIQTYILKEKPDIIIVASHIPITYILPFLYRGKTKISKEIHFTQYYRSKQKTSIKKRIFQYVESKYDSIIVLSKEEKSFYKTDNVIVIPNPTIIEPDALKISNTNKDNIAVTIARFAPVKRLDLLVDIWRKVIDKGIQWKLHIYGDTNNEYAKEILKKIEEYKLQNDIILKGSTNKVNEVLRNSKVSLLVSEQECFPMIILESFSVGTPVISFDCPTGPRNIIIDNKNGLLVENDNIDAFVSIFEKFSDDSSLQEELANNAFVSSEKYSIESIMKEWQTKVLN